MISQAQSKIKIPYKKIFVKRTENNFLETNNNTLPVSQEMRTWEINTLEFYFLSILRSLGNNP